MKSRRQIIIAIACALLMLITACGGLEGDLGTQDAQDDTAAQPGAMDPFGSYVGGTQSSASSNLPKQEDFRELWAQSRGANRCSYVAWSPSGDHLALGCYNAQVQVLDAETGEQLLSMSMEDMNFVRDIAWAPDGEMLASISYAGRVHLWDSLTWEEVGLLEMPRDQFYHLSWSPDGRWLATMDSDSQLRIWDMEGTPVEAMALQAPEGKYRVAWSPDGSLLAISGQGGDVQLWNAESGEIQQVLSADMDWVVNLAWSPDSSRIATGDGDVFIWDAEDGSEEQWLQGSAEDTYCLAWTPGGEYLTVCSRFTLTVWSTADWREFQTINNLSGPIVDVAWSPDRSRLAIVEWGEDSTGNWLRLWSSPHP